MLDMAIHGLCLLLAVAAASAAAGYLHYFLWCSKERFGRPLKINVQIASGGALLLPLLLMGFGEAGDGLLYLRFGAAAFFSGLLLCAVVLTLPLMLVDSGLVDPGWLTRLSFISPSRDDQLPAGAELSPLSESLLEAVARGEPGDYSLHDLGEASLLDVCQVEQGLAELLQAGLLITILTPQGQRWRLSEAGRHLCGQDAVYQGL